MSERRWLNTAEAAHYANCHPETIREAARIRELAHARRGPRGHLRFTTEAIDRWLRVVPARRSSGD
ncbi:MAG: hypothetical protein AMXMBFR33_02050 [Candidatus Xenobia bacterium]